jgi:predicted ferric reductase
MADKNFSSRNSRGFFHPGMTAVIYGLMVLMFLLLADELSVHYGLGTWQRALDDVCGALIAAFLVYRYEYIRSKRLREKLKTIEMMNHHVRNALQVIVDSVYLHGHARQLEEIENSVKRINWALREILPGKVLDEYDAPETAPKKQSKGHRAA